MVKLIYNTQEELDSVFSEEGNYEFAKIIVNEVLGKTNKKFNEIILIELLLKNTNIVYEIILKKEDIKETLETYFPIILREEDYLLCDKIQKTLDKL